jgi:hypothetical protein
MLDGGQQIGNYTASLDASGLTLDTVLFEEGNASVRFVNTNVLNDALVEWTFSEGAFSDGNYLRNYFFVSVYLTGVPSSVNLRFGVDSGNYLTANVTAQFSGQALKLNDWNLLAFDLNTATTVGTINASSTFNYAAFQMLGAPSGFYNINASYIREWTLLDYWYYGKFVVQTLNAAAPDAEFFIDPVTQAYSTDSSLIGDHEWADIVMYEAMLRGLGDKENDSLYAKVTPKLQEAYTRLFANWPDMKPLMTTQNYRFQTDYTGSVDGYWWPS